jgi:polynucleotide 5'-hydroxyl-kinase GRC3/NOL9
MHLTDPTDRVPSPIDIPPSWRKSAEAILLNRWRKVLVLGATDAGKSTYCRVLAGSLQAAGMVVSFVDADVGQKDVGPPATITMVRLEGGAELPQAVPTGWFFVGDVNPVRQSLAMVVGARRMVDAAEGDFVVIDSPGLVEGPGRMFNAYQIESLCPDAIVAIQRGIELEPTLRVRLGQTILRVRPSRRAERKSIQARRLAREQAFRTYFKDGRPEVLDLERLAVQRAPLFAGVPLEDPRFVYAERIPEAIVAIGNEPAVPDHGMRVLPADFADHLLCAVLDARGECVGLGILQRIDFRARRLHLFTPVARSHIHGLQFGSLHLDPEGRHLVHRHHSHMAGGVSPGRRVP